MFSFVYHLLLLLTTNRQETNQTKFYLFTRENRAEPLLLNDTNIHLINKSKEFKYIIHGWKGSYTGKYMVLLKDAYLQRGDYNVVQVDWSNLSDQLYPTAVENTVSVGNDLANFIEKTLVKPERVHIIGFSLGAHIAGVAGDRLKRKQYFLSRITGLDPAGPIFASVDYPIEDRLDRDDAAVVDVIHTDAGKAGFPTALGKMDFYPNGGTSLQPGCFDIENTLDTSKENIFKRYFLE